MSSPNHARIALALALALFASCTTTGTREAPGAEYTPETSFDLGGNRVPSAKTLHTLAHILANQGNDPQCEVVLLNLVAAHPEYAPAYNELAELYLRRGSAQLAEEALRTGLARSPRDAVLLNNLGMSRLMQDDFEGALESFTAATEAHPNDGRSRANMAVAMALLGRYEEAEALYLQATTRYNAYSNLADICRARDDLAMAEQFQKKAH